MSGTPRRADLACLRKSQKSRFGQYSKRNNLNKQLHLDRSTTSRVSDFIHTVVINATPDSQHKESYQMFGRSKSLVPFAKPAIEEIADALMSAGYKGLISKDRSQVESATNGYNFVAWLDEKTLSIQLSMGIRNNDIGYKLSYVNQFNAEWRCGKVVLADDNTGMFLKCDFLIIDGDIKAIFEKYIPLWNILINEFDQSILKAQTRYQAEQAALKREPSQSHGIVYQAN